MTISNFFKYFFLSSSKKKDKKESKKSETSPRKSVDGQKFKSAEFVESSEGSSDSDDDGKKVLYLSNSSYFANVLDVFLNKNFTIIQASLSPTLPLSVNRKC